MSITTINPANGEVIETYPRMSAEEIEGLLQPLGFVLPLSLLGTPAGVEIRVPRFDSVDLAEDTFSQQPSNELEVRVPPPAVVDSNSYAFTIRSGNYLFRLLEG
jgi:hypothetical protein